MATISQINAYSQTALAAYATNLAVGNENNTANYKDSKVGMADAQATQFNSEWAVLEQSAPDPVTGFSAVLLQRKDANGNATGEKVLAIAGTDPASPADLATDLGIFINGSVANMDQYMALESFYSQLVSGNKLAAGEQITITGHSLGGFLAQAFTARHSDVVSAAYTFNAPGVGTAELLAGYLGITNTAAANAKITNVHATDGLSMTAGLGFMLGSTLPVRIENNGITGNHSIVRLSDTLAIYDTYARLLPDISMAQASALFAAAGSGNHRQEDALDALRTVFIGSASNDTNKTPADNHEAFGANLYQLQNNANFKALSGQVQLVQFSPSFVSAAQGASDSALAYRYALLELLPFAVVASSDAQNSTLYGNYTQRLSLYDPSTGQGQLTTNWLTDRASLLTAVVYRNQNDATGVLTPNPSQGIQAGHYLDVASNTDITVGLDVSTTREFAFGGDGADTLFGRSAEDHLYGGAGADTFDGQGGNDYLEGGVGTDTYTFSGQFGNDTILDTDGLGAIKIAGDILNGGKWLSQNLWESEDKKYLYTLKDSNLVISLRNAPTAGSITVKNYTAGQLGLALPSTSTNTPAPTAASSYNLSSEAGLSAYRNADTDSSTQNLLIQNTAAAHNVGTAANPLWLSAWARSGSADDVIEGGATLAVSNTLMAAGAGNDRIYAGTTVNLSDAIERGDNPNTVGLASSHYVLDGGAGDDQIIGSDARDVLFGGAGDDTIVGGAGGDIIFGDGNSGGLLGGAGASVTDALIVDGPVAGIGNNTSLRIDHTGVLLGTTASDSTGRRLKFEAVPPTQYLNPLYSADYTALQNLNNTDIRGLGYSMDVTSFGGVSYGGELTTAQSLGQHTTYQGSSAVGALSTNKETGNDVIFAGAGDDVVNAGAGNDIVIAGDGNDNVAGYEGDDYITGGVGNDVLLGDSFVMGAGADYSTTPNVDLYSAKLLVNGYSIDTSQHGRDLIDGGSGDDQIEGDGKGITIKSIATWQDFTWSISRFNQTTQALNSPNWRAAA